MRLNAALKVDSSVHRETTSATGVSKPPAGQPNQLRIGRELLDTTWRLTTPVVLFSLVGIFIDIHAGTAPWLTLLGVVVGFGFAALLVKKQIERPRGTQ